MKTLRARKTSGSILLEQLESRTLLAASFDVSNQVFALQAGSPQDTVVGTVAVTNPQSLALTYSITGGNGASAFAIDANTGQITVALAAPVAVNTNPTFPLTVTVENAANNITNTATVTLDAWNYVMPLVSNQRQKYTDVKANVVSVDLGGPGGGSLCFPANPANNNPVNLGEVVLSGTTSQSTLSISAQHKGATVGQIVLDGSLRSLSASQVDIIPTPGRAGGILVNGTNSINSTNVRDLLGGADINMSFSSASISSITAGHVGAGSDILLGSSLSTLTVSCWDGGVLNGTTVSTISVNGNSGRQITGNLGAGGDNHLGVAVNLTSQNSHKISLSTLTVRGTIQDSLIQTYGGINTVTTGGSIRSNFLAGVDASVTTHPAIYGDFTNLSASINTFKIKAIVRSTARYYFSAGNISAPKLGTLTLINTDMDTTGLFAVSKINQAKNTDRVNKAASWSWSTSSSTSAVVPSIVHLIPSQLPMDLTGNYGQSITTGANPSVANGTDFGAVDQGDAAPRQIFTLTSTGRLTLGPCTVTAPAGFTVTATDMAAPIPSDGSATFTLALDTSVAGTYSGVVTIESLGTEYGVFTFLVTGTVN